MADVILESRTKTLDLPITQGTDYRLLLVVKDEDDAEIDCTGWTAKSQIRTAPVSGGGRVVAQFVTSFQLSENNIRSVLRLDLTKTESSKLNSKKLFWDLDLVDAQGRTETPYSGTVNVTLEYTT